MSCSDPTPGTWPPQGGHTPGPLKTQEMGKNNPKTVSSRDLVWLLSGAAAGAEGEALAGVKWCFTLYLMGAIWPTG